MTPAEYTVAIPLVRRVLLDNISDLRSVVGSSPGRGQCRNFSNFSEKPPRTSGIATLYNPKRVVLATYPLRIQCPRVDMTLLCPYPNLSVLRR